MKNPTFDDYFTKVGKEMKLLTEAKDIQGEITMISSVLKEQDRLLPLLKEYIREEFELVHVKDQKADLKTTFDAQVIEIENLFSKLERMLQEVEEFYHEVCPLQQPNCTARGKLTDLPVRTTFGFEAEVCRRFRSAIL